VILIALNLSYLTRNMNNKKLCVQNMHTNFLNNLLLQHFWANIKFYCLKIVNVFILKCFVSHLSAYGYNSSLFPFKLSKL